MVFESIVADILNRYLGEYVENLDKGQLKIGIWGGKTPKMRLLKFSECLLNVENWARKIDFSFHTRTVCTHKFIVYEFRAMCYLNEVMKKSH